MPVLGGYAQTPIGEVYLVLLGVDEVGLILVAEDEAPRCLFRGPASEANGRELLPDDVPLIEFQNAGTQASASPASCASPVAMSRGRTRSSPHGWAEQNRASSPLRNCDNRAHCAPLHGRKMRAPAWTGQQGFM